MHIYDTCPQKNAINSYWMKFAWYYIGGSRTNHQSANIHVQYM